MNDDEFTEFEKLTTRISDSVATLEVCDNIDPDTGKVTLGSIVACKTIADLARIAVLLQKEETEDAAND